MFLQCHIKDVFFFFFLRFYGFLGAALNDVEFHFTKSLFMCSFYKLNPPEVRVLTVAYLGIDVRQVFESVSCVP